MRGYGPTDVWLCPLPPLPAPPGCHLAVTRTFITEEDLIRVDAGVALGGDAEAEAAFHRSIYLKHSDVNAVMLARPLHVMAFGVTDTPFDPRTIPESYILLRDVKRMSYGDIYVKQDETAEYFGESTPAALVENDCVIVTGASLLQAFDRLEVMESTAHSIINATAVGQIVHISQEEVEDLKVAFNL